jgi:hypothetical protein
MQPSMQEMEQMLMELADAHPELREEVMALSGKMDELADGPDIAEMEPAPMEEEEPMEEAPMPGKRPIPPELQDEKPRMFRK